MYDAHFKNYRISKLTNRLYATNLIQNNFGNSKKKLKSPDINQLINLSDVAMLTICNIQPLREIIIFLIFLYFSFPLNPKSDQHLISPELFIKIM